MYVCVGVGVRMYVSDNRKHHGKSAPFVCMCNSNRYRCMDDEHRKRKKETKQKQRPAKKETTSEKEE